ncbi:MAG: DUF11 domain-containing protein [Planctomycetaceae bacterium]|nr:DUF11 domain-containing protein [Planctomycetaceae bacterium]
MKRSNFVFILPVLLGIASVVPTLPSYSQTGNPPKSTNGPALPKISAQANQNAPRRLNPLRSETEQNSTVLQVAGTTQSSPVVLASQKTPQKQENKTTEPLDEFNMPIGPENVPNFGTVPGMSAPVPDLPESFNDQGRNSSLDISELLDEVEQFSDPVPSSQPSQRKADHLQSSPRPISRPASQENTVTPQNAQPMAQVDPSATVNLPKSESALLTPPSPALRSTTGPRVASSQRQSAPTRNIVVQETAEGTGTPGPNSLEGSQMPQLVLEKLSPPEVQINQPTVLKTVVRNIGQTTAKEIVLRDQVPRGTRLVSTNPKISSGEESDLYWSLGSLAPHEEIAVEMVVIPLAEGEFGSVATLQFSSEASGKTVATRAMLDLEISGNPEVLLGESITYTLTLSNSGTGTATGVTLEAYIPDGLEHEGGRSLKAPIGDIKPKETIQRSLTLATKAAGEIVLEALARADNNLEAVAESRLAVLAPELLLEIAGPRQRFLNHKVAYILTVANPGTASAHDVDLVAKLPTGMKFEGTNQEGAYNEKTHTVHWTLVELPAKESGEIELVLLPIREGEQTIQFEGLGKNHLSADASFDVSVQGIPSLAFSVACLSSPVEVGKTAVYEVKVLNRGTKSANNVKIHVRLSEAMQFATAEGPTKHRTNSGMIVFDPLAILEPKQEKTYKFTAKCLEVGDHRISVSLSSDEQKTPVTKEESTLVYGDQ